MLKFALFYALKAFWPTFTTSSQLLYYFITFYHLSANFYYLPPTFTNFNSTFTHFLPPLTFYSRFINFYQHFTYILLLSTYIYKAHQFFMLPFLLVKIFPGKIYRNLLQRMKLYHNIFQISSARLSSVSVNILVLL